MQHEGSFHLDDIRHLQDDEALRFAGHPGNRAKARKGVKRPKTIAGRLVRELERKLTLSVLENS